MNFKLLPAAFLALALFGIATRHAVSAAPLSNEVILIIRHAEKQPDGPGLTPAGVERANLYVNYFENFKVDGTLRVPDALYSAADSKTTSRCRLTITPLSQALNIPINSSIKNKDVDELAQVLETNPGGKTVLISWHHEEIGNLLQSLGVNPLDLIPNDRWPEDRYNWLIELRYDNNGQLIPSEEKLVTEHVLPGDN